MSTEFLLKLARAAVETVQNLINQQLNVLEQQVRNALQSMVSEVVGGVWTGDGADAFVAEITNLFIPGSERISDSCNTTLNSITRSIDVITAADEQVAGLANDLDGIFQGIYR